MSDKDDHKQNKCYVDDLTSAEFLHFCNFYAVKLVKSKRAFIKSLFMRAFYFPGQLQNMLILIRNFARWPVFIYIFRFAKKSVLIAIFIFRQLLSPTENR